MSKPDLKLEALIQEAMRRIAERRPGKKKFAYDNSRRKIVTVNTSDGQVDETGPQFRMLSNDGETF